MASGHPLLGWFGPMGGGFGELQVEAEVEEESDMKLIGEFEIVSASPGEGQLVSPQTSFKFANTSSDGKLIESLSGAGRRRDYFAIIDLDMGENSPVIDVRLNGLAASHASNGLNVEAVVQDVGPFSDWHVIGGGLTAPLTGRAEIWISGKDGNRWTYQSRAFLKEDGSDAQADYRERWCCGTFDDLGEVLSSIEYVSSVADAFVIGTHASLYRVWRGLS